MQVDIAQLHKALDGLLSWNSGSQVEIGAHKFIIKAMTWIVDKAETEESAAEVCHLNTTATRLYYERPEDELGNQVALWSHVRYKAMLCAFQGRTRKPSIVLIAFSRSHEQLKYQKGRHEHY